MSLKSTMKSIFEMFAPKNSAIGGGNTQHHHLNFVTEVSSDSIHPLKNSPCVVHWTYYLRANTSGITERKLYVKDVEYEGVYLISQRGYDVVTANYGQDSLFPAYITIDDKKKTVCIEFLTLIPR